MSDSIRGDQCAGTMAMTCTTVGCGSLAGFLDASTQRAARWVQVIPNGRPQDARWYCTQACAAAALTHGADPTSARERAVRARLEGEISAALARLVGASLDSAEELGRRHGLETACRIVAPDRPEEGEARCYLCGCTEDDACAGGCWWVPDPQMRDVCSACAPSGPCRTAGCGTTADTLDENDPERWGWIRVQVAGSEREPVWVCSPQCAGDAIARAGAELAAADRAAEADVEDVAAAAPPAGGVR